MDFLHPAAVIIGCLLILTILVEGFEALVLPRRIERRFRWTNHFYRACWNIWGKASLLIPKGQQDNFLAVFGPLSLLLLLSLWAFGLILAFALIQWGLYARILSPEPTPTFETYLYLSATTFITLGFGDVAPRSSTARLLADLEAGLGFGFLAIVISYLPVLYGAFSRREVEIAMLDARASSPPSAGALLQRTAGCPGLGDLPERLQAFERWSAELLESHLSYPILMYYRSQHDRQSWLSTLTTILDTCAFLIAFVPDRKMAWQARMTFAMSRHAAIDLSLVFDTPPTAPATDRLSPEGFDHLIDLLRDSELPLHVTPETRTRFEELRSLYEPFVVTLSDVLCLALPSWLPNPALPDNWQTSAWDRSDHFFRTADQPTPVRRRIK
ncbi:MAG: potassium channel family protein [Capsulimonadales bacterium]|nr:potassium channel family protein [Capsulimonadales bacterium]